MSIRESFLGAGERVICGVFGGKAIPPDVMRVGGCWG